jgi:small subunit ribosomal protein S21
MTVLSSVAHVALFIDESRARLVVMRRSAERVSCAFDFWRCHENQQEAHPLQVLVRDNNVDQALRFLKKKMQREGVFREMKLRRFYEKPSERNTREKAEAIRRTRKLARKKAQREGLIADPRKKKLQAAKALGRQQGAGGPMRPPPRF